MQNWLLYLFFWITNFSFSLERTSIAQILDSLHNMPEYLNILYELRKNIWDSISPDDKAYIFNEIANQLFTKGELDSAIDYIDSALSISKVSPKMVASSLLNKGFFFFMKGECATAAKIYIDAMDTASLFNEKYLLANSHNLFAQLLVECFEEYNMAYEYVSKAMTIIIELPIDKQTEELKNAILHNLYTIEVYTDPEGAIEKYTNWLMNIKDTEDYLKRGWYIANVLNAYAFTGRIKDAENTWNAIKGSIEKFPQPIRAEIYTNYGSIMILAGDTTTAISLLENAILAFYSSKMYFDMLLPMRNLLELYNCLGKKQKINEMLSTLKEISKYEIFKDNPLYDEILGKALLYSGFEKEAIDIFKKLPDKIKHFYEKRWKNQIAFVKLLAHQNYEKRASQLEDTYKHEITKTKMAFYLLVGITLALIMITSIQMIVKVIKRRQKVDFT